MDEFLSYIKSSYKSLIVSALFAFWILDYEVTLLLPALLIFNILTGYNHFRKEKEKGRILKVRGLTPADAANIEFVKDWEATRQYGIRQYCIKDGGIIFGSFLFFVTSVISYWGLTKLGVSPWAEPTDMFRFIGLNFMAAAVLGSIIFRFKWNANEKRFLSLTDPLDLNFSTVKELL